MRLSHSQKAYTKAAWEQAAPFHEHMRTSAETDGVSLESIEKFCRCAAGPLSRLQDRAFLWEALIDDIFCEYAAEDGVRCPQEQEAVLERGLKSYVETRSMVALASRPAGSIPRVEIVTVDAQPLNLSTGRVVGVET